MKRQASLRAFVIAGLLVAVALATLVSPWANSNPDGLERVAMDEGFAGQATDHALASGPAADYQIGVSSVEVWVTAAAGLVGVAVTFCVGAGLVAMARRRRSSHTRRSDAMVP